MSVLPWIVVPAAYAFARLEFRGRDALFLGYLATMMIPADVLMIPQFVLMKKIPEWLNLAFNTEFFAGFLYVGPHYVGRAVGLDSFFAMIAPGCFSAYGTFMLRQFLLGISHEIEEAAYIDGCSSWGVFRHVILPLAKPALAALAKKCPTPLEMGKHITLDSGLRHLWPYWSNLNQDTRSVIEAHSSR